MYKLTGISLVLFLVLITIPAPGCGPALSPGTEHDNPEVSGGEMTEKVYKTDEEWRQILTPEQYEVTRLKGTEAPFTGEYYDFHEEGVYRCVCCGNELFGSEAKYDSGTGWPSFIAPFDESSVATAEDYSYGMVRNEVTCRRCGAHLGHVFEDGPPPAGLRYCINSVALDFVSSPR